MGDGLRTFLRYGQLVVELDARAIVIGRATGCDILLEDDLASREHCRIEIVDDRVVLTDLESKNGVLVNGVVVSGTEELHHGDCVTVGTQQIVLMRQHREPRMTPATGARRPRILEEDDDHEHQSTAQGDIFQILRGAASASLAANDLLGAETTARNLFVAARATATRRAELPRGVLDDAIGIALELAERSGDVRWIEQALELLVAFRATLSPERASRLARITQRVGAPHRALAEYVRSARELGGDDPSIAILETL